MVINALRLLFEIFPNFEKKLLTVLKISKCTNHCAYFLVLLENMKKQEPTYLKTLIIDVEYFRHYHGIAYLIPNNMSMFRFL